MKKILIPMMALAILTTSCIKDEFGSDRPTDNLSAKLTGDTDGEILGGSLLVRMDVPEGTDVASLLEGTGVKEVVPALKVMPKNIKVAQKYGLLQWYELKFDESVRPQEIAGKVAAEPAVRAVQYNSVLERVGSDMNIEADMTAMTKAGGDLPFNDPMLSDQWNLINTGDKAIAATAVAGADVGVKDAWSLCAGDPRIVVAVFDEGVRVSHDDLKDAMWVNPGETSNGKDDDNNGYADDINGIEGKTQPASFEHAALQYFMDPENSNCDALETNIAVFAAGNDSSREDGISGLDFSREVSIISRPFVSDNGGWL